MDPKQIDNGPMVNPGFGSLPQPEMTSPEVSGEENLVRVTTLDTGSLNRVSSESVSVLDGETPDIIFGNAVLVMIDLQDKINRLEIEKAKFETAVKTISQTIESALRDSSLEISTQIASLQAELDGGGLSDDEVDAIESQISSLQTELSLLNVLIQGIESGNVSGLEAFLAYQALFGGLEGEAALDLAKKGEETAQELFLHYMTQFAAVQGGAASGRSAYDELGAMFGSIGSFEVDDTLGRKVGVLA